MKKQTLIILGIIIFFIICITLGVVFAANTTNENNNEALISKTEDEINFLEKNIIEMMNKLNNIDFYNSVLIQTVDEKSNENKENTNTITDTENVKYEVKSNSIISNDNKEVDWKYIKSNIENLYNILPTIITDLNSLNINKEDILNFSNTLDQVALAIKQEDKLISLNNLASMHSFLPKYLSKFSKDTQKMNIAYTKNCILNSYAFAEQNNWNEVKAQTSNALNYYLNTMNDIDISNEKQNRISKVYILLNEINNSIDLQDKDLFLIKYRNVMQELMNL